MNPPQGIGAYARLKDNSILTAGRLAYKIEKGKAFSISHRFEGIASDSSVDIMFVNTSGNDKKVYIIMVEVISNGQGWIDIYRNNTISTNGTPITPVNLNLESANTSSVNVEYGGTYVAGDLVHSTVMFGGAKVRMIGSAAEVGEQVIIPPNYNILYRITNKAATAVDISIRIIWFEE